MTAKTMFEDKFVVETLDFDPAIGQRDRKFDNVSRISSKSKMYESYLTIDINTSIYPLKEGQVFEFLISDGLDSNGPVSGSAKGSSKGYDSSKNLGSHADAYEYIMSGRIFKYSPQILKSEVCASFGGLLMSLNAEKKKLPLNAFGVDTKIYIFIRKVHD